jgi:trehalose 6-phosphate synthase
MDIDERRKRMHRMRQHLMDHNIYRWAASILDDLRELRMDSSKTTNPVHARPATSLPAEESNPERKQEASIR